MTPGRLAVLVGKNDVGKSNVLRALNLFFNAQTDMAHGLRFEVDHNVFNDAESRRRAREISVRLEIDLPRSYRATNGDFIVWEKRWRSSGLVYNKYQGQRRAGGQKAKRSESVDIPDKSNLHTLLRNINYVYVPAIKDPRYFCDLRASIYKVIAEVASPTLRESSGDFEQSISTQLGDLTKEIDNSLGLQSRLVLPQDLSHIFESLDFLSGGQNISLDARGDGIKVRHIPLILKFMADKMRSLQRRGAQPHSFIWGYEEPENNLELRSCMDLADQFRNFVNNGIAQMFLTTHSPVFYNLRDTREGPKDLISCHHIYRDTEDRGTHETLQPDDLDERMGTMTLFAPMAGKLTQGLLEFEAAANEARELARANRRKLFVEGPSDRRIIEKALSVFAPQYATEIDVETRDSGGGYQFVIDMLRGWGAEAKHTPGTHKAAGLVDGDNRAKEEAGRWNGTGRNVLYAKCFRLRAPNHIVPALERGFRIPIVLETLYDREAWEWANQRGHLTNRKLSLVLPEQLNNRILDEETTLGENLDPAWEIFVRQEFKQEGKKPMSRHFAKKTDAEFGKRLVCLKPIVDEIVAYLFQGTANSSC